MGINDFGGLTDPLSAPPLGGPAGWAASVAAALDGDDTTVNARIAAAVRVTHPNTDDVLVQQWDDTQGRWQTSRYDSGWRDVSGLLLTDIAPIASNGYARMRRINSTVHLDLRVEFTGTPPGGYRNSGLSIINLPAGFRTAGLYRSLGTFYTAGGVPMGMLGNISSGNLVSANIPGPAANIGSWATGDDITGGAQWATSDDIPTSLPGTLVSPAPA